MTQINGLGTYFLAETQVNSPTLRLNYQKLGVAC